MGGEFVDQQQQQQQQRRQSSKLCVTTNSSGGELSMLVWAYAIVRPRTCPPGWEHPRRIEKQLSCSSSSTTTTSSTMDKVAIDDDDFVTFVEFNTTNNDSEEEDTTVDDNVIDNESSSNNNSAEKNNVVHRLFDKIATTLNVKQCTWSELSNVAWSYATVGVACSTPSTVAMMTSIAVEATDRMKRHADAAATAVATTNTSSTQMSNIVRNKSSNNNNILLLPRDAIQIAWALGTMGSDNGNVGHALVHLIVAVHEYWINTISSSSINRPLGKWTCADLVQMATAMAHGRIDNQMMLLAIYDESLTRLQQQCRNSRSQSTTGGFSITEISILLWTQARLYLTPKFGDVYATFPGVASLAILQRMDAATAGSISIRIASSSSTQQNNTSTQPTTKKFDNKQFLSIATTSSLKRIGLGPQEQANIAWSLTILENYNSSVVTLLQHIFHAASSFTTNTNADDEKEVDLIQIEHVHQLWQSYFLLSKDCPDAVEYVTNDFRTYLEVKWNMEKSRSKQSSSRHKAISQTLSLMKVAHRNEYDEDVDVAIVLEEDSAWTHTAVQDFDTDNSSKRWKKVAVEFDGPHHFTVMASTGDELLLMERGVKIVPRVLGHTVLKYRLLKKKGWTVVRIPYYEFDKIPFWASMERQRYLQRALKTHQKIEFSDVDVSEYTPMPSTRNSRFD